MELVSLTRRHSVWITLAGTLLLLLVGVAEALPPPEECTPIGWSEPTTCHPVHTGPWTFQDNSGELGGTPVPGVFRTPDPVIGAVAGWLSGFVPNTFCGVSVG